MEETLTEHLALMKKSDYAKTLVVNTATDTNTGRAKKNPTFKNTSNHPLVNTVWEKHVPGRAMNLGNRKGPKAIRRNLQKM